MTLPDTLNLIGRLFVAFYFLWSVYFNHTTRDFHLQEFARIGISQGKLAFNLGISWTLVGSILLLLPGTAVVGGLMIVVFIVAADLLFHRYWTYENPHEATIHKLFLFEHFALVGGILGLIAPML